MAIITINGVDYQSYVTVDEATEYFEGRAHNENWIAADATLQDGSLVSATQIIDRLPWKGYATSEDQELAWPRVGNYISRRLGRTIVFDSEATEAPTEVKRATFELAYHLLQNEDSLNNPASVGSITVGSLELQNLGTLSSFPTRIKNIVRDLLVNGSNTWFKAN